MSEREELLASCPLCGSTAQILERDFPPIGKRYGVECMECECRCDFRKLTKADAAAYWNRRPGARAQAPAWQPIETAPIDPLRDPPLVMLWVDDGGDRGKGTHAFGRCYRSHDGKIRGVASGFSGNWLIRYWKPLGPGPSVPSTDKAPEGWPHPEVVAAVQEALMRHPHWNPGLGSSAFAFGLANTAIDAYRTAMTSNQREGRS